MSNSCNFQFQFQFQFNIHIPGLNFHSTSKSNPISKPSPNPIQIKSNSNPIPNQIQNPIQCKANPNQIQIQIQIQFKTNGKSSEGHSWEWNIPRMEDLSIDSMTSNFLWSGMNSIKIAGNLF